MGKNKEKEPQYRIFNIMQYEYNPKTGESLNFNESNIYGGLSRKTIKQWAWICHDKDRYSAEDEKMGKGKLGELKGKHWHVVLNCNPAVPLSSVAKWFGVPENCIELPKGQGKFLDCVEYLTHESEKAQKQHKYLYEDEEVHANFDFRQELLDRRDRILKYGKDLDPKKRMMFDVLYCGKTLKECEKENPLVYMDNLDKLKKFRLEYIYKQDVPSTRLNYYITGKGGYGKDVASRALARSLYPQLERDEEIFFEVGGDNCTFEGYDGQPVIIWSERRASKLLDDFKGRENLFKVFDSHPHNSRVNIKYGSIKLVNTVNIVNSPQDYQEFLDGLAGEYIDKQGYYHSAEDKGQSYRRFPIIIPLRTMDIDILFSRYFTGESDNPSEYVLWKRVQGNFRTVRNLCKDNQELANQIEIKMLDGLPEKSHELLANEQELTDEEILEKLKDFGKEIIVVEPTQEAPQNESGQTSVFDYIDPPF